MFDTEFLPISRSRARHIHTSFQMFNQLQQGIIGQAEILVDFLGLVALNMVQYVLHIFHVAIQSMQIP